MNKEQIQKTIADYWIAKDELEPINKLVIDIILKIKNLRGYSKYDSGSGDLVVGVDVVVYAWEEYCSGDTDSYDIEFPTAYLWTENWEELEVKKMEDEKQARIREAERNKFEKDKKDKQVKLDLYYRLQKELGIKEETNE